MEDLPCRDGWGQCIGGNSFYVQREVTNLFCVRCLQITQSLPVPSSTGIVMVIPLGPAYSSTAERGMTAETNTIIITHLCGLVLVFANESYSWVWLSVEITCLSHTETRKSSGLDIHWFRADLSWVVLAKIIKGLPVSSCTGIISVKPVCPALNVGGIITGPFLLYRREGTWKIWSCVKKDIFLTL